MHFFGKSQDEQLEEYIEYLSYRRKRAWIEIGNWMDKAQPNDEFPFELSSNEQKIIEATVIATTQKRKELMAIGLVVIEPDKPDYRWSDLIAYPDVQRAIKESLGFSEEIWIEGVLPILLRLRPSSVAIRQIQSMEKSKKMLLEGALNIGLQTLENAMQAKSESYRNRRNGKTAYPEDKIRMAVSMYLEWKNSDNKKPSKKTTLHTIRLTFSRETSDQPSVKQIERWATNEKYRT